jgi:Uncharacterized conserved protein (DUF2285)
MTIPAFDDAPPPALTVSDYDKRHLVTYLRLLDAADEGADWREAVLIIFGIDPKADPEHAKNVYDTHLARAQWMTNSGYKDLLRNNLD